jgi:hypothetical protein
MLIVYDRATGEIVGHCSSVFDSGKWREPTLAELFPNRDHSTLATLGMVDDARFLSYGTAAWRLKKDENGVVTGLERLPILQLSTEAGDSDHDGIPDLPADGVSVAAITAKTSDGHDVEITFRTTRGALNRRSAATEEGEASVELRAATETVAVTVTATAPGYRPGRLDMEFVPEPAAPAPGEIKDKPA